MINTIYMVRTKAADPAYLLPAASLGESYAWTGQRALAARFNGRPNAIAAAQELAARIRANGYTGVKIVIEPAGGGATIGQEFTS